MGYFTVPLAWRGKSSGRPPRGTSRRLFIGRPPRDTYDLPLPRKGLRRWRSRGHSASQRDSVGGTRTRRLGNVHRPSLLYLVVPSAPLSSHSTVFPVLPTSLPSTQRGCSFGSRPVQLRRASVAKSKAG